MTDFEFVLPLTFGDLLESPSSAVYSVKQVYSTRELPGRIQGK